MLPSVTNQIIFNICNVVIICLYGVYSRWSWDLLHYVIAMAESTSHREILAAVIDRIIELDAKLNRLERDLSAKAEQHDVEELRDNFCRALSDCKYSLNPLSQTRID